MGDTRTVALRPKDAALLALVALAGPIAHERVATLLWPEVTARQAENSLRQRLFRLRRDTMATLVLSGVLLRLAADVQADLDVVLGSIAHDPAAGRAELLGDLDFTQLPEFDAWLCAERQAWRGRREDALAAAAAACEREGRLAQALAYAQRLVADGDGLAEHAQRRLMRLHYLRGDRASAIAVFEAFERRLKDELGTQPSAETIELLATIERGATTLPARRAVPPAGLLRPPRLVGRQRELAALEGAWAARRAFLVVGEAGIGKSRLLQDFTAAHNGVVGVAARPGDAGVAYALLARLLRAVRAAHGMALEAPRAQQLALVLPELGPAAALAGEAQRLLLQRAVEATLADAARAGLAGLVIDDLHFADEASTECLLSLVQSDALAALLWGLAQRPAEGSAAAARLRQALEEVGQLEPLPLQALDLAQVTELIESVGLPELDVGRLAPALLRHTGGNPLFALETLKDLVMAGPIGAGVDEAGKLPQPVSVAALVQRRLAQLSLPAQRLARLAALAGPDFSAELAAAVLEVHPIDLAEPWRELESAHVIRDAAFAHDLIFEATCASVPEPVARLLHGRIARVLADRLAAPERLAPHWAGAGQWRQAGDAYADAARRAQGASQRTHEVACWRAAAEMFERADDRAQAFAARCDSIPALIAVHGVTHASGVIDTLLAEAATDAERAAALVARATAALMAADHASGIAAAVQAGTLARAFDAPWTTLQAARLHAVGLAQAGRTAEALAVIEPCRHLAAREDAPPAQRGGFWADYAYVLNGARRLRETGVALQHAIDHAQAAGDLAELATLTSNLATVQGNLGHAGEALVLARRSLALQLQLGNTEGPEGAVVRTYVGLYAAMAGRYDEALQQLELAVACFRRDGQAVWTAVACNHQAQCFIDLGQFARARQALAYPPPPLDSVRARGATLASRLARAQGHDGGPPLAQALLASSPGADPHVRMHVALEEVLGCEGDAALARCDAVLEQALALSFAGVALKARLLRADVLRRAGRVHEAADRMHEAVGEMPGLQPADLLPSHAWWLAAQAFDAAVDSAGTLSALAQGAQWVREVALPHVPPEYRDSFLHRNPVHRALLAAADRRRLQ